MFTDKNFMYRLFFKSIKTQLKLYCMYIHFFHLTLQEKTPK